MKVYRNGDRLSILYNPHRHINSYFKDTFTLRDSMPPEELEYFNEINWYFEENLDANISEEYQWRKDKYHKMKDLVVKKLIEEGIWHP